MYDIKIKSQGIVEQCPTFLIKRAVAGATPLNNTKPEKCEQLIC